MTAFGDGGSLKNYQDIVNFKSIPLKIVADTATIEIISDPNYFTVLKFLNKGPSSIRDITEFFEKEAKKSDIIKRKSEKTIYRYVKKLEDVGLIVTAGQRLIYGKTATETLFMRVARFIAFRYREFDWMGDEGYQWAKRFSILIGQITDQKTASIESIQKFFNQWTKNMSKFFENIAKNAPDSILKILTATDIHEFQEFLDRIYIYSTLLKQPEILTNLKLCFGLNGGFNLQVIPEDAQPKQNNEKNDYQDILTFDPVILTVIKDKKRMNLLNDSIVYTICASLRKGPMTAKEITDEFKKIASKSNKIDSKSDKTIYRYLKTLEKNNLVVTAGQRVTIGKTATEKLYMRTALIFELKDIEWMSEKGEEYARRFSNVINFLLEKNEQEFTIKCITKFFGQWSKAKLSALKKLATGAPEDRLLFYAENWRDMQVFLDRVYIFGTLLNNPTLLDQLRNCFEI